MQLCTRPSAVPDRPAPPASPGAPGWFTGGDPVAGVAASIPGYEWFNGVQGELAALITGAGLSLDAGQPDQVLQAVLRLITSSVPLVPPIGLKGGRVSGTQWRVRADIVTCGTGTQGWAVPAVDVTISTGAVGAAGLDAGPVQAGAWHSVYVGLNPLTGAVTAWATTACHGTLYTGSHRPAGYTATRRAGCFRTDGAGAIRHALQSGAAVVFPEVQVLDRGGAAGWAAVDISAAVPPGVQFASGYTNSTVTGTTGGIFLATDAAGAGMTNQITGVNGTAGNNMDVPWRLLINPETPEHIYYYLYAGTSNGSIWVTGYELSL